MKTTYLLAAGAALAISAAALPANAAPLSHSGLAAQTNDTLIDNVRWRGRHYGWRRGHHYGWYGPPRHYGYYGYRRPYWDRPYYRRGPSVGFYFGVGPRYGYW